MEIINVLIRFFPWYANICWFVRLISIHRSPFSTPGGSVTLDLESFLTCGGGSVGSGVFVAEGFCVGVFVGIGVGLIVGEAVAEGVDVCVRVKVDFGIFSCAADMISFGENAKDKVGVPNQKKIQSQKESVSRYYLTQKFLS